MPSTAGLTRRWVALPVMLAALGLSACGSSGGGNEPPPPVPPVAGPPPSPPQGPLTGDADALAKTAIQTVDVGDTYTPDEISVGPSGEEIIRTKLQIVFRPEATVGQVNTLLTDLNAVITTSIANFETVVLRIPDPGSLGALDTIVAQIETEPFVWFVGRSMLPTAEALPENIEPEPGSGVAVRHHLAVGAVGAWNARRAMVNSTRVVIWDYFGDGVPNGDLDHAYIGDPAADFATGALVAHGYHVAGIIAGRFGGPQTERGFVTGMMPGSIQLSVIDSTKVDPLDGSIRLLIRLQALEGGTALVNISAGVSASCNTPVTCRPDAEWRTTGAWWVQAIRTLGLENRVLILKSAGNINNNGNDDARYNWFPAIAALSPDLVDANGNPLPPLTNTLVVENVRPILEFPYEGPRCLSSNSWRGGNVGAIGAGTGHPEDGVWSLTNAGSTAGYMEGTSMAAPQVAGLAAYLLSIRPELTPQEIKGILLETAASVPSEIDPVCSAWPNPAPIIQAYPALLALDRPNQGNEQVPVRRAILDINDSRTFTGDDIVAFLLAFETAQGAVDFGRADLNNDGRTGGEGTRPFDIDLDRVRAASGVTTTILGETFAFDETALSDVAILCYYAYSSLYTGSDEARDLLLEPYRDQGQCGKGTEVAVSASFPSVVVAGTAETFEITVLDMDGQPVPDLYVAVEVSGGTVDRSSGETDGGGKFRTQATMNPGAASITLTATVRQAPEGEVLEVVSRSATAAGTSTVTLLRRWDGMSDTGLPSFSVVAQFSHQGKSPQQVFSDSDYDILASQEDFSNLTANLVASGSGAFDGTSASAESRGTRTETLQIIDGRFAGIVHNTSFSARTSMTNPPPATIIAQAEAWADDRSCFDFRVAGGDVMYRLELNGSTAKGKGMFVVARLSPSGSDPGVDYSLSAATHALSREGVLLGGGRSYTFCVYLAGKALWESWRRTQTQAELDGQLDVSFTLEPVPPPP